MLSLQFRPLSFLLRFYRGSFWNSFDLSLLSEEGFVELRFLIFAMASFIWAAEYYLSAPYFASSVSALSRNIFLNCETSLPLSKSSCSRRAKFSILSAKWVLTKSFGRKWSYQPSLSLSLMALGRFWLIIKSIFSGCLWLTSRSSSSMLITRVHASMTLGLPRPFELADLTLLASSKSSSWLSKLFSLSAWLDISSESEPCLELP